MPPSRTESPLAPYTNPESWDMSGRTDGDIFTSTYQILLTGWLLSAPQQGHEDDVTSDNNEGTSFVAYGDTSH